MNKEHLDQIFANYIKKFETINNDDHDENYKWHIAPKFRELMDPDHPDFAKRIKQAWTISDNLIDSSNRYCFSALVTCAEKEPESVRELFRDLFAEDGGDLTLRQKKILKFIDEANTLTRRLHSTNGMYMNDQRSVMAYLFFYDPDQHYLYKASEARDFASCIEFYDDWGPGTDFRLDVYYRMCDMLVEEIRRCEALINTHKSRYVDKNGKLIKGMHPDNNYHILAFDIIYGAPEFRYDFYEGIPFSTITAKERNLHQERVKKAQALYAALSAAQEEADLLKKANDYFASVVTVGMTVKHKMFGAGEIVSVNEKRITVLFPQKDKTIVLDAAMSFAIGSLSADIADMSEKILLYRDVVSKENEINETLKRAWNNFEPYEDYLE